MRLTFITMAAIALVGSGCASGANGLRESPTRYGVHAYAAPGFAAGGLEASTVHPVAGYARIEGANLYALGGQFRRSFDPASGRAWIGGEGSYVRFTGVNGFSVGGLAGYGLTGVSWPASAYGYVGFVDLVGTGVYARIGLEIEPPAFRELLGR